jgi:hypothetical protein
MVKVFLMKRIADRANRYHQLTAHTFALATKSEFIGFHLFVSFGSERFKDGS